MLWGGDAGRRWAASVAKQIEHGGKAADDFADAQQALYDAICVEGKGLGKADRETLVAGVLALGGLAHELKEQAARELSEGVRRGYSIEQLWEGYLTEGFAGVQRTVSGWYGRDDATHDG